MPLIDKTYFVGDLNIPSIGNQGVEEKLNALIIKYEAECLQKLLGYETWKAFTAGLIVDPVAEKWTNLKNGVEFTAWNSRSQKWIGFVNSEKQSILANYVYFHWLQSEATFTSGVGESIPMTENAIRTSPGDKQQAAWMQLMGWVRLMDEYLRVNSADYEAYQYHSLPLEFSWSANTFGI